VSDYVKQKAAIPLGLLSIATYLTQNGHTVRIYDRAVEGGRVKKYLDSFSPDFVGISSLGGRSFDDAMKVSKDVRKYNIPVIWGGPMPSLIPEILLKSGNVDFVIMGDGEITFLALINSIVNNTTLREIDGLAFIENGTPVINKDREFADLSEFPVIDFSFVDPRKYYFRNRSCKRMLHIYLSKGCPGQCTYCYSPGYSKCIWRSRPTEYVLRELRYLVDNYDMDGVYFVDDLLSPNREYLYNLCNKLIESNLGLFWSCDMRTDNCTKEDLQIMYDAGCRWIFFGVESGSEERQKAIKKRLDLKKAAETINNCREIGISTTTSFVIGFPDETEEDIKKTIRFMQNLNSDVKIPALFAPLPKSEMYDELVKNKRLAVPSSYEEWKKLATIDSIGENFSKVPTKELKVITGYFYLSNMSNKTDKDDIEKGIWVKRLFRQAVDMIKRGNLKSVQLLFLAAKEFLEIIYYATMYPKILKKYDLS
jgi:radical SAM superfamily enzyme YgiQ (UPF0313 family)